jgi:hypothetical protein
MAARVPRAALIERATGALFARSTWDKHREYD